MDNFGQASSNIKRNSRFPTLRFLFVCGFALETVLTFVPKMQEKNFLGSMLGESKLNSVSSYNQIQQIFQAGDFFTGLFAVTSLFTIGIAFIVLAFAYPKRWIFITGSSYAAYWILVALFIPGRGDAEYFIFYIILGYVANALKLSGFFVRPTVNNSEAVNASSHHI